MLPATGIAFRRSVGEVRDVIAHWAATVCIQEPTLVVNWATQRRRKTGWRSGVHPLRLA
jgi:hypothetical protein